MNDVIRDFFQNGIRRWYSSRDCSGNCDDHCKLTTGRNLSISTAYLCIWYVCFSLDQRRPDGCVLPTYWP